MSKGFTTVELMVTIILVGILSTMFIVAFKSSIFNLLNLQTDATASLTLNSQVNRISTVLRGATDITSADNNELVLYSYFYPSDQYVSLLRYYTATTGGTLQVKADLTPMTANPPIGTPLTAQKRTFVIIDNYYQPGSTPLFQYLDIGGNTIATPVADLKMIKSVRVQLAAKGSSGSNQKMTLEVSLRNRKTNL
ncbi:MAG: hypothetical protein WAS36_02135 [Candidatus Saccharimonadales bacterium]